MSMLEIRDLEVNYGMIAAIKGVSFDVNEGEVIALIGANGAGKTTILHTITGLLKAKAGSIMFEGHELTKTPAHKIVELGMAHVPEGRRIFSHLTVLENLKLGAYTRKDKGGVAGISARCTTDFPGLRNAKSRSREPFPEASSRCSPWGARLCQSRVLSLWTSLRWDFRRYLSARYST